MRPQKEKLAAVGFWRVSIMGHRPEYLGVVEASDRETAEANAIRDIKVTPDQRRRLVLRQRKK
jgi:hypothetical protein